MVSTDPPYYDNIGYADLSDYFYVWLREMLKSSYPELFRTMLVPKTEELTAISHRFKDGKAAARKFFEEGMLLTFKKIFMYANANIPVTVYYAYKQTEGEDAASTGWETMLEGITKAGFMVTGTWPIRTEKPGRMIEWNTNALASSIVSAASVPPMLPSARGATSLRHSSGNCALPL